MKSCAFHKFMKSGSVAFVKFCSVYEVLFIFKTSLFEITLIKQYVTKIDFTRTKHACRHPASIIQIKRSLDSWHFA